MISQQSASLQNDQLQNVSKIFSNIAEHTYTLLTMTKTTRTASKHKSTCNNKKVKRKLLVRVNITHGRFEALYFYSQVSERFMLPFGVLKGARRRAQNIFLKRALRVIWDYLSCTSVVQLVLSRFWFLFLEGESRKNWYLCQRVINVMILSVKRSNIFVFLFSRVSFFSKVTKPLRGAASCTRVYVRLFRNLSPTEMDLLRASRCYEGKMSIDYDIFADTVWESMQTWYFHRLWHLPFKKSDGRWNTCPARTNLHCAVRRHAASSGEMLLKEGLSHSCWRTWKYSNTNTSS